VNTVWNQSNCLRASPLKEWSRVGFTFTIGYTIAIIMWIIDMIWDNKGGSIHYLFWRTTQLLPILPALGLIFIFLANRSYGTRPQVYNTWFGGDLKINGGVYSTTPKAANWSHDAKYILWKD